jgi:hypothetical protein
MQKFDTYRGEASHPARCSVGPPPPFDVECAAMLDVARAMMPKPFTLESIPQLRAAGATLQIPDEQLLRGGAYRFIDVTARGPPGAPDITLLICTPTCTRGAVPAIYHTHGGGMIAGDRRAGIVSILDRRATRHGSGLGRVPPRS